MLYCALYTTVALSANTDKFRGKGVRTNAQVSVNDVRADAGRDDRPLRLCEEGRAAAAAAAAGRRARRQRRAWRAWSAGSAWSPRGTWSTWNAWSTGRQEVVSRAARYQDCLLYTSPSP